MNDYKELIEMLRHEVINDDDAAEIADAIEQLVNDRNASVDALKALGANIDAEPVVHGRWIDDGVWDVCSVCGRAFLKVHLNGNPTFNYCPNCGAKMDEEV